MAKGQVLCVLCCVALAQVFSAAVPDNNLNAIQKKYAYLQVEIDEWNKRGHPDRVQFDEDADQAESAFVTKLPQQLTGILDVDYPNNVFFYLYTRENANGTKLPVTPTAGNLTDAGFDPARPTKIVTHGFGNNIGSTVFQALIPNLLKSGDINLIAVDWGNLCKMPFYIEARNHVGGVGKEVAKLVDALVQDAGLRLEDTHAMGHSLGAHVCANIGKNLKSGKMARITGLDPAMPLFLVLKADRLAKGDAETVDVIHTCAGLLGIESNIGDVDFYPNGGSRPQPGCGLDLTGSCSHSRSFYYMGESAVETNAFPAYDCASVGDANRGECSDQVDGNMGLHFRYNASGSGTYYVQTASSPPYDISTHLRAEDSK